MNCAVDPRCQHNCENKDNFIQCLLPCVVNGCQCPEGQVVNELTNECVEQIYKGRMYAWGTKNDDIHMVT